MIEPLRDYVLMERIDEPHKGLIVIPDVAKEKSMKGKVLAVGPGKLIEGVRKLVEAKVGELWYFNSKWSDLSPTHYVNDQISDRKLHLVMEGDLLLRCNNGAGKGNSAAFDRTGIAASANPRNVKANQKRRAAKARVASGAKS